MSTINRNQEYIKEIKFLKENGINFMPVYKQTKKPVMKWGELQSRKITDEEIKKYFSTDKYNIGVLTGAISDNLFVVDCDSPEVFKAMFSKTEGLRYVQTGRGYHVYFKSEKTVKTLDAEDSEGNGVLTIKGEGGYCITPPSLHKNGKYYKWINRGTIDRLVGDPREQFKKNAIEIGLNLPHTEVIDIAHILQGLKAGALDNGIMYISHYVRRQGASFQYALKVLLEWRKRCKPVIPEHEITEKLKSHYAKPEAYSFKYKTDPAKVNIKPDCALIEVAKNGNSHKAEKELITLEELKAEEIDYGDSRISNYVLYKTITPDGVPRRTYTEVWLKDQELHEEICQPILIPENTAPTREYQNGERFTFPEIYKHVLGNVTSYGAFEENSIDPILISLGVMISYYIEAFEHVPYFDYTSGEAEVGKTTVAKVQTYMSFRGSVCASVREAPIFRELEETHGFYLIDNSEHLFSMPRNNPGIIDMLLASHAKGARIPRVAEHEDENGKRPVTHFDCFGIKVFTHIHSIPPILEPLRTRCIPIYMQYGIPTKKGDGAAVFASVRDMQYLARHYEFETIKENYNAIRAKNELTGRIGDIYNPLLAVAKEVSSEVYDCVLKHAVKDANGRHALNPRIGLLIETIFRGNLYGKRSTTALAKTLNVFVTSEDANAKLSTPRSVNDMLRKLGLRPCELRTGNLTWFNIDEKVFGRKAYDYGILTEEEHVEYDEVERELVRKKLVRKKVTNFPGTPEDSGKAEKTDNSDYKKPKVSKLVEMVPDPTGSSDNDTNSKPKVNKGTTLKAPWKDPSGVRAEIVVAGGSD